MGWGGSPFTHPAAVLIVLLQTVHGAHLGVPAHPQLRDHPLKAEEERDPRGSRGRWCRQAGTQRGARYPEADLSEDMERSKKVQDEAISENGASSGGLPKHLGGRGTQAHSRRLLREAGTTGPRAHQYTRLPQTKGVVMGEGELRVAPATFGTPGVHD